MKSCPMCGTEAEDDVRQCAACQYSFKDVNAPVGVEHSDYPSRPAGDSISHLGKRPTGEVPTNLGWLCLAGSLILLLISFGQGPQPYEVSAATSLAGNPYAPPSTFSRVAEAYARQWYFQMASGGLLSLSVILLSVGYIVRAISFLPGKEDDKS